MKRIKHWLLTIAVLLCSISASAHDFEVDGIYYNITSSTDMTVEVTYKGSDYKSAVYSGVVVIPETVTYGESTYSVTSVGYRAFLGCSGLISVEVPKSVTRIGSSAFEGCSSLTNIEILYGLISIDDLAFHDCYNLFSIEIPKSVIYIGSSVFPINLKKIENNVYYVDDWAVDVVDSKLIEYALCEGVVGVACGTFKDCVNMQSIELASTVKYINTNAFSGCCDLKGVNIPVSVTSIGDYAFCGCSSLKSVVIPKSVIDISDYVFSGCSGLTSVVISDSVTSIGSSAFEGCSSLTSVKIPDSVTRIASNAFSGCFNLKSVVIPESVTSIGGYAFSACYNLDSIVIPKNVEYMGDSPFQSCLSLKSVSVESNKITSNNYSNYIYDGFRSFFGEQVKEYIIGCNIRKIGDNVFYGCDSLITVIISSSIDSIGYMAFSECHNLNSIIIDNPTPPYCTYETFDGLEMSECVLTVPNSSVDLYSKTYPWSQFNIIGDGAVYPTVISIIDNETSFNNKLTLQMDTITYTRTFQNTEWQALYIPFSMSYSDWSEDFDIAKINNVHQFDEDDDDVFDRTVLEVIKVKNGTLKPNHPYMIRAKSTGTKTVSIENATLMPAESNSIDCSSVERKYIFTGTYTGVDGETMVDGMYYGMCNGELKYATNIDTSLKPFRWYMHIFDRDGQVVNDIAEAKVIVRGEDDWGVTDIEDVKAESGKFVIYSIGGTLVRNVKADNINQATEGLSAGMYIINGKKHFIR